MKTYGELYAPPLRGRWRIAKDDWTTFSCRTYPCWFHRFMQRICFGIHWEKL